MRDAHAASRWTAPRRKALGSALDGIHINGVDIIHWDAEGKIDDFKVMVRPLKAINLLHRLMKQMLERMSPPG